MRTSIATEHEHLVATTGIRPRWWREVAFAAVFYGIYSAVRNLQGSAAVSYARALTDAQRIIHVEQLLHVFDEESIQHALLNDRWLIDIANVLYGSLHFIVTIAVLIVLFRRNPDAYRRARNALAAATSIALVGFAFYPTAPPRLLPSDYGFVDTLARYGTLWSFDSGSMSKISNQYAAMPSLHFAWALWCAIAILPLLHSRRARIGVFAYPALTLAVIIITANHFFLDAAMGAVTTAAGFGIAALLALARAERGRSAARPAIGAGRTGGAAG
jgi:hypothetical protein